METTFKEKQDFNRALQIALDTDKRVRVVEWLLTGGSGHFAKGLGGALRYADFNNINKIARTWSGIILEAYDLSIR
jgi:6-phosphogluconate dehydrogenase